MTIRQTATEWPEGVIARYLTVGGAPVDISAPEDSAPSNRHDVACSGCGERDWFGHGPGYCSCRHTSEDSARLASLREARGWSQRHAEKCRAMPRPDGGAR